MKRIYSKPEWEIIELCSETSLMAGSDIIISDDATDIITDPSEQLAPNLDNYFDM
ncbi:MAG: hypothetical protein IJ637_08605 [Prevotella sp.]|nr:hypothetical protein [Prevotella sp.]